MTWRYKTYVFLVLEPLPAVLYVCLTEYSFFLLNVLTQRGIEHSRLLNRQKVCVLFQQQQDTLHGTLNAASDSCQGALGTFYQSAHFTFR